MPDTSPTDTEEASQPTSVTSVSGGVTVDAQRDVTIGGDVVGRDKITTYGYTVEQVSTLLTQISTTFQPKPFDGRCPYLGLDAFSEDDADRFFGRETLVSELVGRVKESRFVVIAGPSGSGKSSLVRAGLIHALKQGALPASQSDRWLYATLTPGRDPIESLALAMSRMAKSPDAGKYVREHSAEPRTLDDFVESQLSDRKDQRAVIFVDQFEEIFTQVSKEEERIAFLNLLTHAATIESGRVTVLFAMRSDFVSNCATYPQLNALLNQQFMQVGAMQADELVSAIARPALQVGLRIDPDLIAQIVNDMQDEPGALPLMQFALKDLFDAQQAKGGVIALTLNDYLARGGLRKALERHADAAFAQLSHAEQQLARTIFSGLIEIGRGTQDTRRTAVFDELVPANTDVAQVIAVVQRLADARLITTDERDHHVTVTIAHETLIDAWPWLRKLINENREAITLQNQIAEDAEEWNEHHRDASYLYSGARLATAREELTGQKIVLSELAQQFVATSIEAEESARQREKARQQQEIRRLRTRNRIISAIGLLALAAMLVAVFFADQSNKSAATAQRNAESAQAASTLAVANASTAQAASSKSVTAEANALAQRDEAQRQARIAISRQLAAQALSHLDGHGDLALLLATEAYQIESTIEAHNSLLSTLQSNRFVEAFIHGHPNGVWSVAFSPDGKTLASGGGSADDPIILWDVSNPRAPTPLGKPLTGHTDAVQSMAFSPDGKTLASGGADNAIILWDVSNPRAPRSLSNLGGNYGDVMSVAFSPDGRTLASVIWNGGIDLWDVSNPREPTLLGNVDFLEEMSVAFSPDGKTLASGGSDNTISLLDVSNPRTPTPLGKRLTGHTSAVTSVAFSSNGKTLASGSADNSIILWDVSNPRAPTPLGKPLTGHTGGVASVAFSPDGKTLVSGGDDQMIILWDVSDPRAPRSLGNPLIGNSGSVLSVAFSPNGQTVGSSSCGKSPYWSCTEGEIILWDVSNPRAPTPLGKQLAGDTSSVYSVAFSPDSKTLASSSSVEKIMLWDVSNPRAPTPLGKPLAGHTASVASVAFSPDGKTLASGSGDSTIILWDVSNPRAPTPLGKPLTGHTDYVWSVAFSPDGKTLASGSQDRSIILWDDDPKSWQLHACQIAGRNLTHEEYATYINPDPAAYDDDYAEHPTCPDLPVEPLPMPTPVGSPTP